MPAPDGGTILRLSETGIHWREVEGEILALDGDRSEYLGVNRSGAVLWTALAEGATREQLVEALVSAEGIERARGAADVDAFLGQLRERGLVTERSPGS